MRAEALSGGLADEPAQAARAFRAAMRAMARPGDVERLSGAAAPQPLSAAAGALLLTLADPETPVHLAGRRDAPEIREWLTFHTGAPLVAAGRATFAVGDWASLTPLGRFPVGTPEHPDRSASLIVEMDATEGVAARLSGPGIEVQATAFPPEIEAFQANAALFPLGLDFWFCRGEALTALPRTTKVEAG